MFFTRLRNCLLVLNCCDLRFFCFVLRGFCFVWGFVFVALRINPELHAEANTLPLGGSLAPCFLKIIKKGVGDVAQG